MTAVFVEFDMVTAYGRGVDACWKGLHSGASAIAPLRRFRVAGVEGPTAATVDGLAYGPDCDLDGEDAASLCLQLLAPLLRDLAPRVPRDAAVVLASITGEVDLLERHVLARVGDASQSRLLGLLCEVQELLGNEGPGLVVSAACASGSIAVAQAASMIRDGEHDAVLVVACDAVTEFAFAGFSSLMALAGDKAAPFDRDRCGLSVGEAAACTLLMSDARAAREGREALGAVLGWGGSDDAHHMTGPSEDGAGLALAIERALRSAGVARRDLAAVSAHGTGTVYNDAMEMTAFRRVLGPDPLPVFSVKGGIGHTMAAAGLVETGLVLRSLAEGRVPPTVGCRRVTDAATGWVSAEPREIRRGPVLTTNSGFGGVNSALVLAAVGARTGAEVPTPCTGIGPRSRQLRVVGAARWSRDGYAALGAGLRLPPESRSLRELCAAAGLDDVALKGSERLDATCVETCFVAALALADARRAGCDVPPPEIGLVASDPDGCVAPNERFFRDYVAAGRTLARASLFIYTLPSSPAAETAIRLRLQGPMLYVTAAEERLEAALAAAARILRGGQAAAMVVTARGADETVALLVQPVRSGRPAGSPREVPFAVGARGELASLLDTVLRL